jgi:hypothetical protein
VLKSFGSLGPRVSRENFQGSGLVSGLLDGGLVPTVSSGGWFGLVPFDLGGLMVWF